MEPGDEGRRGRPDRGRKMQPDRIRDSPLRTTKARKDRTRQAGAIRSELFMTSLLKGCLLYTSTVELPLVSGDDVWVLRNRNS